MLDPLQPVSPWPCDECGGVVILVTGACEDCARVHREPQPGPQSTFIDSDAKLRIFIGAMGSGKTFALLLDWLIKGGMVPGSNGVICRRHAKDIEQPGGLWDEAQAIFDGTGAVFRGGRHMDVRWPELGTCKADVPRLGFRHLEDRDVERFKGPGFTWVGIEEASEVSMESILWLFQRMRSSRGIRTTMALTTNSAPLHPLRQWVDWYLEDDRSDGKGIPDRRKSGAIRYALRHKVTNKMVFGASPSEVASAAESQPRGAMTYTVVSSWLEDNVVLDAADPEYRDQFEVMLSAERAKNLELDWNAAPDTGGMFARSKWPIVTEPLSRIVRRARGWDKAATRPRPGSNPDFTAGVDWQWDTEGRAYVSGLAACREEPAEVLRLQRATATLDGPTVTQACFRDPAAAGLYDELTTTDNFRASSRCGPVVFESAGNQLGQKVLNATPVSQALDQGKVYLLAGSWLDEPYSDAGDAPRTLGELFWSQVGVFVDPLGKAKDDIVDGMSVGFRVGSRIHVVTGDPRKTAADARKIFEQRLQQRGGRGYGGRR